MPVNVDFTPASVAPGHPPTKSLPRAEPNLRRGPVLPYCLSDLMPYLALASFVTSGFLLGSVPTVLSPQSPGGAVAPGTPVPEISAMRLDIWPEFDDPRVLVIYDGLLAPETTTPTDFTFVVPPGAQIHMAGGIAADGGHVHADFQPRMREDGLMEVAYRLEVPRFYMEFYYDPFAGGEERSFVYPVRSPYPVDSLLVRVQEPLRAENFAVVPLPDQVVQDDRGMSYRVLRFADVAPNAENPITVSYRKSDREPSVAREAPGAPPPAPGDASPWRRARTWILGTLAAAFFAIGFYRLLTTEPRAATGAPRGGSGRSTGSGAGRSSAGRAPARFCTECGHPAEPGHRYCGRCGQCLSAAAT